MLSLLQLLSKHRAAVDVAAVASTASLLFGFDTGVAGSVVALKSFSTQFEFSTNPSKAANISSNVVALLNAGAFFGVLAPAVSSRYIGRKPTMALAACLLLIGGTLQTTARPPSLSMIYGGRVISGFGVGMVSNLIPVYVAETAPKELRGLLMCIWELFLVSGALLAYWTTYGCSLHLNPTSRQWRIPLSLQIILAAIVLGGSFKIVESPRWFAKQDRWGEAETTLAHLRGTSTSEVELKSELAEMHAQLDEEFRATEGRTLKELLSKANLVRLVWGCSAACLSIWCGQTALLYYSPTIFKQIGFVGQNASLFASGMFTVIKVAVTIPFLAFGIQHFGRKKLLSIGTFFMMVMLFSLGAILKTHPPIPERANNNSPSGRAMMATIYLYVVAYQISWGPLIWVYMGEIFPTRIRDYCMAIATMVIWFMNFVVSKWTPTMLLHIGWKTWMVYGTMNAVGFIFTLFLPETKNLSLEEMDILFHAVDKSTRQRDIEEYIVTPGEEKIVARSASAS